MKRQDMSEGAKTVKGYKLELTYHDAVLDFEADADHGMTKEEWHAKRHSLKGHYSWIARITSHNGRKRLTLHSRDFGPKAAPWIAIAEIMSVIGIAVGQMENVDAKDKICTNPA